VAVVSEALAASVAKTLLSRASW